MFDLIILKNYVFKHISFKNELNSQRFIIITFFFKFIIFEQAEGA